MAGRRFAAPFQPVKHAKLVNVSNSLLGAHTKWSEPGRNLALVGL